jgi:hypothetical protein
MTVSRLALAAIAMLVRLLTPFPVAGQQGRGHRVGVVLLGNP